AGRRAETRVIVEGVVDFEFEITLLTVRHVGGTDFCDPVGHRQESGDYVESWQPQPMSPAALDKAKDIALKVTEALGGHGLFGVELFINGDEVWFSEVSPRPHDTGLVTLATQAQSEFALHARAILGLPVDTKAQTPGASAVIYGGIESEDVAYDGLREALSIEGVHMRLFGKPVSFEKRRMGVAIASGPNVEEALARAKKAAKAVKVVSSAD
ncbi:MAG: ATP-grasp domain-containing protein, partial [Pseudomonadota bacterium]